MDTFYNDVKLGLSSNPKKLFSKYFYDKAGDSIFQKLMHSPEYYLSKCELEILKNQSTDIVTNIIKYFNNFDLIELGAGDASKSIYLLESFQKKDIEFTYYPIDISHNVINSIEENLHGLLPTLKIKGLNGEYLDMLKRQSAKSQNPKVVLFLGSNIGNMTFPDAIEFCKNVHELLNSGDFFFIGFDLKKKPTTILSAYNDKEGLTKDFNLNLLHRINKELNGNFNINKFHHYPSYDPISGECKSYLISNKNQEVSFGKGGNNSSVKFKENEPIFMEISKKYDIIEIEELAGSTEFHITNHFFDSKKWFVNSLWKKN